MYNLKFIYKKAKGSSRGSTLVLVVVLFTVAVLLCAAVLTAVMSANMVSSENEKSKQAYFTARSAANTALTWIENNQDSKPALADSLVTATTDPANPTSISKAKEVINDTKMGSGSVKLEYWDAKNKVHSAGPTNTIKITGIGKFPSSGNSVTCKFIAYMKNTSIYKYTVFANQNFSTGTVSINNGLGICSTNHIELDQPIDAKYVISLTGDIKIAPVTGTSNIGSIYAKTNVDIGKNVSYKNINAGDSITVNGTSLPHTPNTDYINNLKQYMVSLNLKHNPIYYQSYDPNYILNTTDKSHQITTTNITNSGYITQDSFKPGDNITVDTSSRDIWLYFEQSSELSLNNITITKKGDNKIFFILYSNPDVKLDHCKIISNHPSYNDIFILSDATSPSKLFIGQSNIIDAFIYMNQDIPVYLSGSDSVVNGSVTSQQISPYQNDNNNLTINYIPPDLTGTLFDSIIPPDIKKQCSTWVFSGWDSK